MAVESYILTHTASNTSLTNLSEGQKLFSFDIQAYNCFN